MESNSKCRYRTFCEGNFNVPIFAQPWYLDTTCGLNWDVALCLSNKGKVVGFIPYFFKKRGLGLCTVGQAPLTPYTYLIMIGSQEKIDFTEISTSILTETFSKIKRNFFSRLHFAPNINIGLALHAYGNNVSYRYTYILEDIKEKEAIWKGFNANVRNHIKRNEAEITIVESQELDSFWNLVREVFSRQGEKVPFAKALLEKLNTELSKRNQGKILLAKNKEGDPISGVFLLYDKYYCYCLLTGTKTEAKNLHPLSSLYWKAIQLSSLRVDRFDFLGSMIPNIERMFRSFNGKQTPYISAVKAPLFIKLLKGT